MYSVAEHYYLGSWNDADMSLEFREKLLDSRLCPDQQLRVVSDSVFICSAAMCGRILLPLKEGGIDHLLPSVRSHVCKLHNAVTSVRQATGGGWGSSITDVCCHCPTTL